MPLLKTFLIQTIIILCSTAAACAVAVPAYNFLKKKYISYSLGNFCNHLWYFLMSYFLLIFAVQLFVDSTSIFNLIFNANDTFMDFFNPIAYISGQSPYAAGDNACYSGLSFSFYLVIAKILSVIPETAGIAIKMSKSGMFALYAYTGAGIILFAAAAMKLKIGVLSEKFLFLILILCSSPFIYQFERTNIIFLVNILIIVFFIFRRSKNKTLFESGLICLAAASAIKIYPAVFVLVLIKDKKFKETARFAFYCIALFFIPFFFFGNADSVKEFFTCLINLSKNSENMISSHWVTIHNFFSVPFYPASHSAILKFFRMLFFAAGCLAFFAQKDEWKGAAILSAIMILLPARSAQYTVIFMTLPLILFLNAQNKTRKDIFYSVLFAGTFAPLAFGSDNLMTVSIMTESISIIVMSICLIYESIFIYARKKFPQLKRS